MKDKAPFGKSSQSLYRSTKNTWTLGRRGWWFIAFALILAVAITGVILTISTSRQQDQDSIENIQRMHSQLAIVAASLNKIQPENSWVDKSKCYVTEDMGFGYEATPFCEARFEMARNEVNHDAVDTYVRSSLVTLKGVSPVEQLQGGNAYSDFGKQIYPNGFILTDVKMSQGACGLVYTYIDEKSTFDGQIYCKNEINKNVFDQLGPAPFEVE